MKKALKLRPLEERMNDSYTAAELYAAFRDQVRGVLARLATGD